MSVPFWFNFENKEWEKLRIELWMSTIVSALHGFDNYSQDAFPFVVLVIVFLFIGLIWPNRMEMLMSIWKTRCLIFANFFQRLISFMLAHVWMVWFQLHIIWMRINVCLSILIYEINKFLLNMHLKILTVNIVHLFSLFFSFAECINVTWMHLELH